MLSIDNLTFTYPGARTPIIAGLNAEFKPGNIIGLLGTNGVGKSTLLYLCAGLLNPAEGSVKLNGVMTSERHPSTLSDIFLVAEDMNLPSINISTFAKRNSLFYPKFSADTYFRLLQHFRLEADMNLGRASMGQRKKALMAFALACNTPVLLLDEPTNGLDIPGKSEFRRALIDATSEDRTIIISTHQVRDLDRILNHVMILGSGNTAIQADIAELQKQFLFKFTTNPVETIGALWVQPSAGGYNMICTRRDNEEETDVNLESLFEFAYENPEALKFISQK